MRKVCANIPPDDWLRVGPGKIQQDVGLGKVWANIPQDDSLRVGLGKYTTGRWIGQGLGKYTFQGRSETIYHKTLEGLGRYTTGRLVKGGSGQIHHRTLHWGSSGKIYHKRANIPQGVGLGMV